MTSIPHLDPDALFEHSAWMRGLARRLVLDDERADDVVQEAWRAALENPPRQSVPLHAWLAGIVRNQALFLRRSEGRRAGREADAARPERVPSTAELAACADEQRRLLEAVLALPEAYRDVVLLRFYEGLEPRHIAARLGVPVNTVRTRQQRALERLRAKLDEQHGGDRGAWCLALLPLARADAALGLTTIAATSTLGALVMGLKTLLALAAVTLVGLGIWNLTRPGEPDFSRHTTPAEAADELFGKRTPPAPQRAAERVEVTHTTAPAADSPKIRGRVLDLYGHPIEDARIQTTSAPQPNSFRPTNRYLDQPSWATSAADGSFERDWSAQRELPWLEVVHENYFAVEQCVPSSATEATVLTMAPLARTTLAVEVIDATTGRPAPRYRIMASIPLATRAENTSASWTALSADSQGAIHEFEVEFATDRPLHLLVDAPGLTPASDRASFRRTVQPIANARTPVRFVLDLDAPERDAPHLVATGRILDDATSEPIAGAEIHTAHPTLSERRAQSLDDGTFRIALSDASATVTAHHPHYVSATITANTASQTEIRLTPRGSLRGVLVDGNGTPLPHAPLLFIHGQTRSIPSTFESDSDRTRTTTDAEGRFAFEHLRPNRYHLFALRSPKDPDERSIADETVGLRPGEHLELTFSVEPPDRVTAYGNVTTMQQVDHALTPTFLPYAAEGSWTPAQPTPDGYRAPGLKRGRYLVLLAPANDDHNAGPFALLPNIDVAGFGEQRLDFRYPTGSLTGRIVLDEPRDDLFVVAVPIVPPGFAHDLLATGKVGDLMGVPVARDGSFTIEHLAEGAHRVELCASSSAKCLETTEVVIAGRTRMADWRPGN
ncbi:MAG: sigma-70 family RNA polymerase sigma factor [Planctomycetes bacterium]|nr:sigma-70 family RNA polymerase sigma factor [Planctomycetota bacterium]